MLEVAKVEGFPSNVAVIEFTPVTKPFAVVAAMVT